MARTWPVTRSKAIALAAFDAIARPVASVLPRSKSNSTGPIRNILVVEIWHLGDVVLATPLLQNLRRLFPHARICLLAKEHARDLLRHSDLVDEVITYDFPWTASRDKYKPARYHRNGMSALIGRLRAEQFDVTLDCRMDLRSNVLTRATMAPRRIGYDFGGGGFLLTDALPPSPVTQHKVEDWLGLLAPLLPQDGDQAPRDSQPRLTVTHDERNEAATAMRSYGIVEGDFVVGIHPGGSHDAKRWATDNFEMVGRSLAANHGAKLVVFIDPTGTGSDMEVGHDAAFVRTSIREMMALLTCCSVLLCNDSGPMHIAAALEVPVVAVFTTGNPDWYGPRGLAHQVVGKGASWGETAAVDVDDVIEALVHRLESSRTSDRVAWPAG